jgi:hypothetical protein
MFQWSLNLGSGMSGQLVNGALVVRNAAGTLGTVAAPTVVDAAGASGTASWALSADGTTMTLSVDPTWLSAPGRAFPVVVDPSFTYLGPTQGCTLNAAHPTTTYCDTSDLGVGASGGVAQRSVLYYPGFTDGTLPVDAVIQGAEMDLPVDTQTGSVTVNAYGLTRGFNSNVTWNSYDGTHNWTTAGGDFATTPTSSATAPGAGNTMALSLPTGLIQSWVDGGASSSGIELKASSETGTNLVDFEPQDSYDDNIIVNWSLNGGANPAIRSIATRWTIIWVWPSTPPTATSPSTPPI